MIITLIEIIHQGDNSEYLYFTLKKIKVGTVEEFLSSKRGVLNLGKINRTVSNSMVNPYLPPTLKTEFDLTRCIPDRPINDCGRISTVPAP